MTVKTFNLNELGGVNGFTINGAAAGDLFAAAADNVGNIGGDGFDKLVIGARSASPGGRIRSGQCVVLSSRNTAWPASIDLSSFANESIALINGRKAGDHSCTSIAAAGDFNNDGYPDFLIGAQSASPYGRHAAGQVDILYGRGDGWPDVLELSSLNRSSSMLLNGAAAINNAGVSVASVGRLNHHGMRGVLVGAFEADPGDRVNAGVTYLFLNNDQILPGIVDLGALNGTNAVALDGISAGDFSGFSVASMGDANGDGIEDFIIGAYAASPDGKVHAGQTYLLFGHETWSSSINLSNLNGSNGVFLNGAAAGDISGHSVAFVGDVNNDGFDDFAIGAAFADPNGIQEAGRVHLVFGREKWPQTIDLASLSGTDGVSINGVANFDHTGFTVAAAGDLNHDGIADFVIGARGASPGGKQAAGQAIVLFGHAGDWDAECNLSELDADAGMVMNGIAAGDLTSQGIAAAGDLNGDGIGDLFIGAPNATVGHLTQVGRGYVLFGGAEQFKTNQISISSGETLRLTGENIAVEPFIGNRNISVSQVSHGRFAFFNEQNSAVSQFTQDQVSNGEVAFVHDGSNMAPSYTVSAGRVTRIFSDIRPEAGNVTFTPGSDASSTLPWAAIAGGAVAGAVVLILGIALYYHWRKAQSRKQTAPASVILPVGGEIPLIINPVYQA